MSVVIGSRVTTPEGKAGVVIEEVSHLAGKRWRVRTKDGELGTYRTSVYHESALTNVQAPTTYVVGDRVRIGPMGPNATVTAVNSGNPTTYTVSYTHVAKVSGMQHAHTSEHTAAELVAPGE